jgi:glutathione-independent formaldehyde dehydrogenase
MRAVVYKEAYTVAVEDVDDPKIEDPTDAIIKITTSAICGSETKLVPETAGLSRPGVSPGGGSSRVRPQGRA